MDGHGDGIPSSGGSAHTRSQDEGSFWLDQGGDLALARADSSPRELADLGLSFLCCSRGQPTRPLLTHRLAGRIRTFLGKPPSRTEMQCPVLQSRGGVRHGARSVGRGFPHWLPRTRRVCISFLTCKMEPGACEIGGLEGVHA